MCCPKRFQHQLQRPGLKCRAVSLNQNLDIPIAAHQYSMVFAMITAVYAAAGSKHM